MPLRKALLEAPLSSGLNQAADRRDLVIDGATQMQNCVRNKQGAIRKRVGVKGLSTTLAAGGYLNPISTPVTGFNASEFSAVRGINYGFAPLMFDGYLMSSYSDSKPGWNMIDATPEAVADARIPVASIGATVGGAGADIDYSPSLNYYIVVYTVLVGLEAGGPHVNVVGVVIDATSGIMLRTAVLASFSSNYPVGAKVIISGTTAVAAYASNGSIFISKLDLTNLSAGWLAPQLFASGGITVFDISAMPASARFAVTYFTSPSIVTSVVDVVTFSVSFFSTAAPVTTGNCLGISINTKDNEWCWVGYCISHTGQVFEALGFNDSTHALVAPTILDSDAYTPTVVVQIGIARISTTDAVIIYTKFNPAATAPIYMNTVSGQQVHAGGGAVLVGSPRNTPGVMLYSKPTVLTTPLGVRCYALVVTNSALQGTLALVCFDWFNQPIDFGKANTSDCPARLVATISPRLAKTRIGGGVGPGAQSFPPKIVQLSATKIATISYSDATVATSGMFIQPFDFDSKNRFFGDVLAGSYLLGYSGGAPSTFDGQTPAEMGYIAYPEVSPPSIASGGGQTLTGAYSYIFLYLWPDALGNLHYSATSPPVNVTLTNQNPTFKIPTIGLTWRQRYSPTVVNGNRLFQVDVESIFITVYRTVAGGTTYYIAGSIPNNIAVDNVTFTDTSTDQSISGPNATLLYTTGGILDNYCPPSAKICITHMNRWFLAGCDDPTAIWPSKAFTYGEAPGFNEQMNLNATGAVMGLASLDEKLIVFVRRGANQYGIEYVVGLGPFDTGASNDWTNPPQPIPSSVGAIDQRSIVVCELGVMFLSPTGAPNGGGGIFLLSRDLQVHYISGAVEDLIDANPVCTGAVIHPSQGRAYFEMARVDNVTTSTGGVRLVYDWLAQCWSSDTHFDFAQSIDGLAARTTWVAGGLGSTTAGNANMPLVYWANSAGAVFRENSGLAVANAYVDVSNTGTQHWITMQFSSAWFKPALSGFTRFWRVQLEADRLDPASCGITYTFDYASAVYYSESDSWTDTQIAAFDRAPQVDVEHLVGNQKAKAIAVQIIDQQPSGSFSTGQGISWATISIECGVDDGGRYQNLPSGQRS